MTKMNYPKRYEKALLDALNQYQLKATNTTPSVDEIYRLLETNLQKRLRKQQIQTFLLKTIATPENPQSSHNSSASEDNDSDSKKKQKKSDKSQTSSPDGKSENETRERSIRTIKRKQVFDPSDYTKAKKAEKLEKDKFCKICEKEFDQLSVESTTPLKKTTCVGCKKRRAHRACISPEEAHWRCEDCRLCAVCDDYLAETSTIFCNECKQWVHEHCAKAADVENVEADGKCLLCLGSSAPSSSSSSTSLSNEREKDKKEKKIVVAKADVVEPTVITKPKLKATRRNSSLKKEAPIKAKDENDSIGLNRYDDDIPDCSRWTPHQVYSYLIIYVPSEDAKAFLDQEIDGRSLKLMRRSDVISNFNLKLGSALKVYAQVKRLQDRSNSIKLCWP